MNCLRLAFLLGFAISLSTPSFAQMLDDDFEEEVTVEKVAAPKAKDEQEELFDEMFGDRVAPTKNKEPQGELETVAEKISKHIKNTDKQPQKRTYEEERAVPIEGDLKIGVSKGSFKLSQDMLGRTVCTFGVTLKSTINKEIKTLALRLVYKSSAFAFVFRDVKAGGSDEKYISTKGDICYNLSGAPDIDINRCRIYGANENECAKRLVWDEDISSPDPEKNPYL